MRVADRRVRVTQVAAEGRLTRSVTSTVPPADIGTAAGVFATMRQLGGAFGVAVLGAVFAGVILPGHRSPLTAPALSRKGHHAPAGSSRAASAPGPS